MASADRHEIVVVQEHVHEVFAGAERRVRLVPASANGQPAFAAYYWREETGAYELRAMQVLTLRGDRIKEITGFADPAMLRPFGLPARLTA